MKKVIYTAIFGDYDMLAEPKIITPGWDYICFTDREDMTVPIGFVQKDGQDTKQMIFGKPKSWDVRYYKPEFGASKDARNIKINYHKFLPEYDLVIWIDGCIRICTGHVDYMRDLDEFVKRVHKGNITFMKHPARDCIYDEAKAIVKDGIAKEGSEAYEVIQKQIKSYKDFRYPKNNGLAGTGVNIRNKNDNIAHLMRVWWREILIY